MFKKQILLVILTLFALQSISFAQNQQSVTETDEKVFTSVEQKPEFPGGDKALMAFIAQNLKYPKIAREANIQGKVFVQFIVEKDGSVTNVKVLRGIGDLSDEAIRVVNLLPKWIPGKQNGQTVRVYYTLPITFKLE